MKINRLLVAIMLVFSITTFSNSDESVKINNESYEYFNVYDPLEPINRRIYYFNYHFEKYVSLPAVRIYRSVTPNPIRQGITNFFKNTDNISTTANSLLQFKIKKVMRAIGRFSMNTAVGVGGVVDIASDMGMPKPYEDFGMTLAHYGVGKGAYLVLPILGPSFLRDTVGMGVDTLGKGVLYHTVDLDEMNHMLVTGLYGIDKRNNIPFKYYDTGSPFEYEYMRFLYYKYRELQIQLGSEIF